MKIVCESCGAKYSIADEKVAGKVFKIRCKRCSEVIMVRGDQDGAGADAGAGYDSPADAIWHVVVNGEQQGPYAPPQLGEMLTAGTVDWDAYVWTEGFDNWVPMRDVEDLVAQITGQPQANEAAQTTAAGGFAAASEAYAAQPSMGADPFADEAVSDALAGNGSAGPDLFSSAAAAAEPVASGGVVASAPSPRVSEEQAMTGARNENSVLFSLKNLQALATGSSTPSAAPVASASAASAGFASGEGSGLIDIRALASATGVGTGHGGGEGDKDELLAMGGQGAAFGALGSPMLAPVAEESDGGNKTLLLASIIGGAVVLAGGLVAFAMLSRPEAPPPAPAVVAPAAAATAAAPQAAAEKPAPEEPEAEEPKSEGELAALKAKEAAEEEEDKDDDRRRERSHSSSSKPRKRATSGSTERSEPKEESAPAPKPKPRGGSSSLDDLLNAAVGGGGGKAARKAEPEPDANLPDKPSRNDVIKAMNGVKDAVSACAKGASGVAFANITVAGSTGRVKSAEIEGQTGAVGSCIARAVRKARFPKFKSNTFQIKYPFRL